jgi:hypothetical protein
MHRARLFTRSGFHCSLVLALAGCALFTAASAHATPLGITVTPETTAGSSTGSVELSWLMPTANADETALTDLAGVVIYYGTSASNLSRCVVVSGEAATSYTIAGLGAGTWYFGVEAFTTAGGLSELSDIVSTKIP